MFKSGFQPVCVLYQGNQSPLDGSCQLVCRHQIQEQNFSQGDIVKVVDLVESGGSSNGREGLQSRQAIVMGQEMVSSLIGTLFQTKQSEDQPVCSPQNSSKKRKTNDEQEVKWEDKLRQEEIGVLRDVFSTVKVLKEEFLKQGMELSHMKQRQVQMMNLLDAVLRKRETKARSVQPPSSVDVESPMMAIKVQVDDDDEEEEDVEEVSGPIIASVRSTSTGTAGRVLDDAYSRVPEQASSPGSDPGSATFGEDLVYSAMEMSPGHDQGWEQDQGSSANIDHRKTYLETYRGKWRNSNNVEIGNFTFKVMMPLSELEDILYKTNNATSFAYRLAGKCFTSREMLEGNTRGGGFRTGGEVFKQLSPDVVEMIAGEVKKRFPLCASEVMLSRSVRNAINERARNERKRVARVQVPFTGLDTSRGPYT